MDISLGEVKIAIFKKSLSPACGSGYFKERLVNYGRENRHSGKGQIQPHHFCLTIEEAFRYFGIGEKKLRKLVHDNLDAGFVITKWRENPHQASAF